MLASTVVYQTKLPMVGLGNRYKLHTLPTRPNKIAQYSALKTAQPVTQSNLSALKRLKLIPCQN
jgi:hypothetical protein